MRTIAKAKRFSNPEGVLSVPKHEGVYRDGKGRWYFKVEVGRNPVTGRRSQLTRRGYATATDAARARRRLLDSSEAGPVASASASSTVNELLDEYLDGMDLDQQLSPKTRYDYRRHADLYVRPWLGSRKVRSLSADVILAWQRELLIQGGARRSSLSPNTVRLARAPLAGALRMALSRGILRVNPLATVPRPSARRSTASHWTPEQARSFLSSQEHDRLYSLWAFLLGSGVRIGELVWMRWGSVDLNRRRVRIVDFATRLGWELVASEGKSTSAVRTIDLDDALVALLKRQADPQPPAPTAFVFTNAKGAPWHPATLSRILAKRSVEAGLPRLTAHGLRHTSATLMLDSGVPSKVAAERLGHADPTLFTNLYSHVTPTMQRDAAQRIGLALFDQPTQHPDSPELGTTKHSAGGLH